MTDTTTQLIKANLALLEKTIPDITTAYESTPFSIADTDLPAFVNLVGPTQSKRVVSGAPNPRMEIARMFFVRLYGTHVESGMSGEAESRLVPFLDTVPPYLQKAQGMGDGSGDKDKLVPFIKGVEYQGDNGIQVMPAFDPKEQYLGIEWRFLITYHIPFTYAANE